MIDLSPSSLIETVSLVITAIFLVIVLSYYVLLVIPKKNRPQEHQFTSITVIIPARNEAPYIKRAIESVQRADFKGEKKIICVDDASLDETYTIASAFHDIRVLKNAKQLGKSATLNKALELANTDLVAVVDGDSEVTKDAITHMVRVVEQQSTAGATGVVKVKNRKTLLGMWLHIEQLYNSLMRLIFSKIGANITTPGPLSIYRTKDLKAIGGFSTEGFSEDVDVTIRLIRAGHKVQFSPQSVSYTNMPVDRVGFFRQRTRFARGLVNILKRHLQLNSTVIDLYTLPLFLFSYIQAVVMGSLTVYNITSGYYTYYASKGVYFGWSVIQFFIEWFSLIGFGKWAFRVLSGAEPLTLLAGVGILSTLLSYPLLLGAILRFDKKIDLFHIIPFVFMFPFWLLVMLVYIVCLPEYFAKEQYNQWKKNEA